MKQKEVKSVVIRHEKKIIRVHKVLIPCMYILVIVHIQLLINKYATFPMSSFGTFILKPWDMRPLLTAEEEIMPDLNQHISIYVSRAMLL